MRAPVAVRFWAKVDTTENCWNWTAEMNNCGYGRFWVDGKKVSAHRWVYEQRNGSIPAGMEIDHLCHNRRCVNPAHLEVVTHAENQLRRAPQATCRRGHPFTPENTRVTSSGRVCRTCLRALRGSKPKRERPAPDVCIRGHSIAGDNAYTRPGRSTPECRTCRAQQRADWRAKRAA